MSAYQVDCQLLEQIHHVLQRRTELERQLARGPRQVDALRAAEKQATERVEALKQLQQKTRMAAHEKQLQLKQRETRIADLKNKRNTCKSNREYSLLNDQIAADTTANSVLQDEILELLEKVDQHTESIAEANAAVNAAQQETQKLAADVDKRLQVVRDELDRVLAELKASEAKLPGEIRADYRRRVDTMKDEALAPLQGDACGSCSQMLTLQVVQEIQASRSHTCSNCNAILYAMQPNVARV
jgi:predicted  nucleic acid-binding Zn-ribbon protein